MKSRFGADLKQRIMMGFTRKDSSPTWVMHTRTPPLTASQMQGAASKSARSGRRGATGAALQVSGRVFAVSKHACAVQQGLLILMCFLHIHMIIGF